MIYSLDINDKNGNPFTYSSLASAKKAAQVKSQSHHKTISVREGFRGSVIVVYCLGKSQK